MCAAPEPGRSIVRPRRRRRPRPSWLAATAVALTAANAAGAAPVPVLPGPPTPRQCVVAWNDERHVASQARLRALGATWASLLPATLLRFERAGKKTTTSSDRGCWLQVFGRRAVTDVTGTWTEGSVRSWTFRTRARSRTPASAPVNVRVRADGRLRLVVYRVRPLAP